MTANAGYHAYATGDVLTAAQVQYNLQNQTVMYFATTTARDAALTGAILVEGMTAYTPASGVMVYNGSAWVAIGASSVPTSYGFTAGKNAIINGDFGIWQRGTSFSNPASGTYLADRWYLLYDGTGATRTISQQTFTPGTAPVAGYEGTYYFRYAQTVAGTGATYGDFEQRIEDVRAFAGQTVTISFWAKVASGTPSISVGANQNFGSGGSAQVAAIASSVALSTSWTRYTVSAAMPSIAGKTIGTSSYVAIYFAPAVNTAITLDVWGMQVESGSTATSFQTATGTKQGELAACQRYYVKSYNLDVAPTTNTSVSGVVWAISPNVANNAYLGWVRFPVTMRSGPTVTIYSYAFGTASKVSDMLGNDLAASSGVPYNIGQNGCAVQNNSGGTITAAIGGFIFHYVASAEL